ncbi:hypothetical protein [Nonomuraea basaltis]|uniref:hypothetical protein n=1 Tax=Nonomuraea basaltis TaxID=2495887 RepID=UPI00110C6066|nr:hypothetical protein [Nonomuraea basaltis]TMR89488.1 hypothetical protein EJK15_60425 [Nonomuraea basaltis]
MNWQNERREDLTRRAREIIDERMAGGLDIRAAAVRAASEAKQEALGKGWPVEHADHMGYFVAQVGAEYAADLIAADLNKDEAFRNG